MPQPEAQPDHVTEQNKAFVRLMHREILERRDLSAVDTYFAEDFVSHNMPPRLSQGREGVRQFFEMFRDGLADMSVDVNLLVAEEDWVAVATTTRGIHKGALFGVPASGKELVIDGIDMVRLEGGQIVEHRGLTDTDGVIRQLGGPLGIFKLKASPKNWLGAWKA